MNTNADTISNPQGCAATPGSPSLALSVRQPWAWLILHGKDIENRNWPTKFRGRILLHAGKGMTRDEYSCGEMAAEDNGLKLPPFEELQRGGIVGEVEIVDCVDRSTSPWFMGDFGFVLRNPKVLPFQPCKGALGFFRPELPKPLYWQSWAEWPPGIIHNVSGEGENCTVDRHDTEAQAAGVCDLLRKNGFGGERCHFPVKTWTVPVYAGNDADHATASK